MISKPLIAYSLVVLLLVAYITVGLAWNIYLGVRLGGWLWSVK